MDLTPTAVRVPALAAPVLLGLYGLLRFVDGRDGDHGSGVAWDVGHALFFAAIASLGILISWDCDASRPARRELVAAAAAAAMGLVGTACFLWVIVGDLSATIGDAAPLPEPLELLGPLFLQLGLLVPMGMLVAARPRRLPLWSPILTLAGFALFAASLDLIPLGVVVLLAGLAPLASRRRLGRCRGALAIVPLGPGRGRSEEAHE